MMSSHQMAPLPLGVSLSIGRQPDQDANWANFNIFFPKNETTDYKSFVIFTAKQ